MVILSIARNNVLRPECFQYGTSSWMAFLENMLIQYWTDGEQITAKHANTFTFIKWYIQCMESDMCAKFDSCNVHSMCTYDKYAIFVRMQRHVKYFFFSSSESFFFPSSPLLSNLLIIYINQLLSRKSISQYSTSGKYPINFTVLIIFTFHTLAWIQRFLFTQFLSYLPLACSCF